MLNNIFQPYHTMQEINLDWILTKVKNILRFVPDDGAVGQILRRTAHGAEWSNEQGGGAVDSVNGQTGTVVLTASDVGALPDTYVAPVTSVNGQTGDVIVSGGAVDSVNGQTGIVVLGKSDIGLGNVDNVQQYSATNPPPYPVTSVNSQTGAVSLAIPTDTGDLTNGAGYVTSAGAAAAAPVQSVNGQTGAVLTPFRISRLWSNPGTVTAFDPQTILLDLSSFDFVMVIPKTSPERYSMPAICPIGKEGRLTYADGYQEYRPFTVTATGIDFSDAVYVPTYGSNQRTVSNVYLVPAYIFGIKE